MNKKQLFNDFINENIDNAYRFAYTYAKNQPDAEDILNDSVLKAVKAINNLKNPEKIKPWFYRIIANTAITFLADRKKMIFTDFSESEALLKTEDDYSASSVESIIKNLPEKYKTIVVLRFCEDMQIADIARVLSLNENTVKTRLYSALKKLKMEDIYE